MKDLLEDIKDQQAAWAQILGHLQGVKGFDPKGLARYFEEGPAKKGIHFFLVRYEPGEVIMAKGTTSDYAALHVSGLVRVRDSVPATRPPGRGCWDRPRRRRLESFVLARGQKWGDAPPRSRWLGWLSQPLAAMYATFPEVPLRLIEFCERWLDPPTPPGAEAKLTPGRRFSEAFKDHVARVLHGRLGKAPRAERELSDPSRTVKAEPDTSSAKVIRPRDADGKLRLVEERFLGISGTLWNQPRSVTLVADKDGDEPCVMLLVKRKVLQDELIKKAPDFYKSQLKEFVDNVLPDALARNRFFINRLFVQDILDRLKLLEALQGRTGRVEPLRERIDARFRRWLERQDAATLTDADWIEVVEKLNDALSRRELSESDEWCGLAAGGETKGLLEAPRYARSDCQVFRLNRLLLETAVPGAIEPGVPPLPLSRDDFRAFTNKVVARYQAAGKTLQPERLEMTIDRKKGTRTGAVLCKQGDPANEVILLLTGMVRVSMDLPGGRTMVNNLGADTYLGESAVLDEAAAKRTATVETICDSTVLRIDRAVLRELLAGEYQALGAKLRRDRALLVERDQMLRKGELVPPSEPPLEIAEKLVLTRNLLLIDMNKCTRCDQCVRGCAENHDGQPRFHRANPELRFGMYEVAGACLHCLDAPCQQACPVGAIAFLEDKAVQIHRDRCIGCEQCAKDCPFGVIDMYAPTSPDDAPSSKKGKVANKCDLCLTEERDPPCVACCPYDAARRADPLELFKELRAWSKIAGQQ